MRRVAIAVLVLAGCQARPPLPLLPHSRDDSTATTTTVVERDRATWPTGPVQCFKAPCP